MATILGSSIFQNDCYRSQCENPTNNAPISIPFKFRSQKFETGSSSETYCHYLFNDTITLFFQDHGEI